MAQFVGYAPCPKCREKGKDREGDNLGMYSDDGGHCFSCGYHVFPKFSLKFLTKEPIDDIEKAVLPRDFTRDVPAEGWRWLLQYGLPHSYWKEITGYSPSENRLILTFGKPVRFSQGRALTVGDRKWKFYGDGHKYVQTLSEQLSDQIVLVEDLISAHKVAQVSSCLCLFGTHVHDLAIEELKRLNRPVVLWLDEDQYIYLPKKINRLKALTDLPVRYVSTRLDPKMLSVDHIKALL